MTVSNALDPIELPANVRLFQERGLSRYRPLSNMILPHRSQVAIPPYRSLRMARFEGYSWKLIDDGATSGQTSTTK
jgi:hypothetical protein